MWMWITSRVWMGDKVGQCWIGYGHKSKSAVFAARDTLLLLSACPGEWIKWRINWISSCKGAVVVGFYGLCCCCCWCSSSSSLRWHGAVPVSIESTLRRSSRRTGNNIPSAGGCVQVHTLLVIYIVGLCVRARGGWGWECMRMYK